MEVVRRYLSNEALLLWLFTSIVFATAVVILQGDSIIAFLGIAGLVISTLTFFRYPKLYLLIYLGICTLFFDSQDGITTFDLIYFLAFGFYFLIYFLPWLLTLSIELESALDKLFLALLFILGLGIILGILMGAPPVKIFGDTAYYLAIPSYFGFRRLAQDTSYRRAIFLLLMGIILFITVRNILNYRQLLIAAYLPWQAENARIATNEVVILFGASFTLCSTVLSKNYKITILSLIGLGVMIGTLILTQSRGYWLAFIVTGLAVFLVVRTSDKWRMILIFVSVGFISLVIAQFLLGNFIDIVFSALAERFSSITSNKLDVSLLERLYESQAVVEKIMSNPIIGYGAGTGYRRELLFQNYVETRTFIHNGYLLVWYKYGLPGILIFLAISYHILVKSYRIFKNNSNSTIRLIALSIFSTYCGMLLVNNTSPQFYQFDSLYVISLMSVFVAMYSSKEIDSDEKED